MEAWNPRRSPFLPLLPAAVACLLLPAPLSGQAPGSPPSPAAPEPAPTMRLEKTRFAPGEEIRVSFTALPGYAADAWVGLVPSHVPHGEEAVNDRHVLRYEYLKRRASGVLIFQAPKQPGNWDLRMHDTDQKGREVASFGFTVADRRPRTAFPPALRIAKMFFAPGEEIRVSFTAPASFPENAWIGIVPAGVPHGDESVNDTYDVTYEYLGGRASGVVRLKAPTQPGRWDLRMHDTDNSGREVAWLTFTVLPPR